LKFEAVWISEGQNVQNGSQSHNCVTIAESELISLRKKTFCPLRCVVFLNCS